MSEEKYKGQTKRIWYQKGIKEEQERIIKIISNYAGDPDMDGYTIAIMGGKLILEIEGQERNIRALENQGYKVIKPES